jgi:amino acid adenylation domain-containing protein
MVFDQFWANRFNYSLNSSSTKEFGNNIAYILYTSGSTGMPKGVEIQQNCLHNFLLSMQKEPGITAADTMLSITTITFDIAELEIYLPLISGASLHIVDMEVARDGRKLLEVIKNENISIVQATPFTWRMMLEFGWEEKLPIKALIGGEALPKELAAKLVPRCNELWNMYGPTETTIWSLIKKISIDDPIITIGKPIQNTNVYLLDEQLNEVPTGEIGEIYIGGAGVGRGYVRRPELTVKAFIEDKFTGIPGKKIYKTGDLGKMLESGEVQCLGRIDHQIKIRGFRVETEEIEFQLKQQENVKQALVIAHKDALENVRLIAYIVPHIELDEVSEEKHILVWKNELNKVLPEYMLPSDYMAISEIPLMSNGKVNRKALPEPVIRSFSSTHTEPISEMENKLLKIWTENIGIQNIGTEVNFFELGGNSLIAIKVMLKIEEQTGKRLPIATLFRYPTIKRLASFIEEYEYDDSYNVLVPIKDSGTKPPLYIVHGIGLNILNLRGLAMQMDIDQPVFGLQAVGLNGKDETLENIEEVATFYINEILHHNPEGPYAIAGYSFGGYIAFEMVKQLKVMKKKVILLAMFDTNVQNPAHQYKLFKKIKVKSIRQYHKVKFRIKSFAKDPIADINFLKTYFQHRINSSFSKAYHPENMPAFMVVIAKKLEHALRVYSMKPCDVKIDLFKANERLYFVDDPKFLGWKKYALGGVQVYTIPGDHKIMLYPPNDKIMADILQNRLNEFKKTAVKYSNFY